MSRLLHLEDRTGQISGDELAAVANALTIQAADLARWWRHLPAAMITPAPETPTSWPIRIVEKSSAGLGVHLDRHGHPYAEVTYGEGWTVTASHEVCEMLVDPRGRRFDFGPTPDGRSGWVLIEVCDPVEAVEYYLDGVALSDFCTPAWYGIGSADAADFRDAATPGQVLPLGYLSWIGWDRHWHQAFADASGSVSVQRSQREASMRGDLRAEKDRAFAAGDS